LAASPQSFNPRGTAWRPQFHAGPFTTLSYIIQDKD
jgi:hypothetical protein